MNDVSFANQGLFSNSPHLKDGMEHVPTQNEKGNLSSKDMNHQNVFISNENYTVLDADNIRVHDMNGNILRQDHLGHKYD